MTMTGDEIAWLKVIAKRVKIARIQHDLTQADLAERASLADPEQGQRHRTDR